MIVHNPERLENIQRRTEDRLKTVANLFEKVKDPGARKFLQLAQDQFEDVQPLSLRELQREQKTPDGEAGWLMLAEVTLQAGEAYLKPVQDGFERYGPGLVFIL